MLVEKNTLDAQTYIGKRQNDDAGPEFRLGSSTGPKPESEFRSGGRATISEFHP